MARTRDVPKKEARAVSRAEVCRGRSAYRPSTAVATRDARRALRLEFVPFLRPLPPRRGAAARFRCDEPYVPDEPFSGARLRATIRVSTSQKPKTRPCHFGRARPRPAALPLPRVRRASSERGPLRVPHRVSRPAHRLEARVRRPARVREARPESVGNIARRFWERRAMGRFATGSLRRRIRARRDARAKKRYAGDMWTCCGSIRKSPSTNPSWPRGDPTRGEDRAIFAFPSYARANRRDDTHATFVASRSRATLTSHQS